MINNIVLGRLGNQMFQYATMRALQEKFYKDEIINLNFTTVRSLGKKEEGFDNQLLIFKLNNEKVVFDKEIYFNKIQKIKYYKYNIESKIIRLLFGKKNFELQKRKYEKSIQNKYNRIGLFLYSYGFYDFPYIDIKNKIFKGYFESSDYFNSIKEILIKEFTPKEGKLEKNKELYKIIETSESVCVSIRRGDFLSKKHKEDCFVCDNNYFNIAIDEINKRVKNPKFIIFSDDIKWCQNNMVFPAGTEFEDGTDPIWEKLRLMYSCKHFIISNSTFSWWAQYLSKNEEKVVIAPKKWRNNNYVTDIYEKNWNLI